MVFSQNLAKIWQLRFSQTRSHLLLLESLNSVNDKPFLVTFSLRGGTNLSEFFQINLFLANARRSHPEVFLR